MREGARACFRAMDVGVHSAADVWVKGAREARAGHAAPHTLPPAVWPASGQHCPQPAASTAPSQRPARHLATSQHGPAPSTAALVRDVGSALTECATFHLAQRRATKVLTICSTFFQTFGFVRFALKQTVSPQLKAAAARCESHPQHDQRSRSPGVGRGVG